MTSILKNQLLKHLSRYTKNLSPDKINISTFRGEGELYNLQLDEEVLTELLELPEWLRLTSAWCNHVSFRVHWTKLKSTPITLTLDEVRITIETCNLGDRGPASPAATAGIQSLTGPQGKYSFINKVIDGITILVNSVNVNFVSPAFTASIQMSRIRVESKTPKWLLGDLRVTRLKDQTKGLILIFKELSWQTVRIEASSTQDKNLTPLRLLTNQARCRITIKKKLSDCSVLSSRLVLILDDLLWVLTDSQLKAALHFVDSLTDLIQSSTNVTQRTKAQRKLETLPEYQALIAQQSRPADQPNVVLSPAQKSFAMFDVKETSYHFFSQRIDLHLCDDAGEGRSCHPSLKDGGALQISVQGFQVDYYPYHLAKSNRAHWPKYREANAPPALWLEQSLNAFRESLLNLNNPNRTPNNHAPLERTPNFQQNSPTSHINIKDNLISGDGLPSNHLKSGTNTPMSTTSSSAATASPMKRHVLGNLSKLMTSNVIVRIEDFQLFRVTTTGKKQMPKEFISGDKERYSFPPELPALHAEYTYFYYPGDSVFPLPPSKMYIHINPVQINFDLESCLWFSSFALNLHESLLRTSVVNSPTQTSSVAAGVPPEPSLMYMDVKMEAIMPRIIFDASSETVSQRDRPKTMIIQISRLAATNVRETGASRADLAQAIHALQEGSLVFASDFPSKEGDLCVVTDRLLSHVSAADVIPSTPIFQNSPLYPFNNLTRHALWIEPRDIWCIKLDPVWVDFFGARSIGPNRAIPFVDAVPVTFWLHGKSDFNAKKLNDLVNMQEQSNSVSFDDHSSQQQQDPLILSVANLQYINNLENNYNNVQYSKDGSLDRSNTITTNKNLNDDDTNSSSENTKIPSSLNINDVVEDENVVNSADLHIVVHVANLVSVQIDHYQYLFLLRLSEELTELATFLSLDSKRIMNQTTVESDKSIVVGCVIPQVEVTLVMPSQTPGKEMSGGDGESVMPDSASLGDDLLMNSMSAMWPPTTTPPSLDMLKNSIPFATSIESQSPLHSETGGGFFEPPQHIPNPNTHGYNVQIQSEPVSSQIPSSSERNNVGVKNKAKPPDIIFSKEINSTMRSMKKGFSSLMTSFDTTLKQTSDDVSDTFSMHSDISSDSENFIMILSDSDKNTDCMDVMFKLNPFTNDPNLKASPVEVANEVYEENLQYKTNMSSPSEPSEASSCRRRDLVSMVTFRLTTVELIRQNQGYESSIRVQVSAVSSDECGAIPWDEFQSKFGTRCRAWNIADYNPEAPPVIKLRLEEILQPPDNMFEILERKSVLNWFSHKVDIKVKDLNLNLSMSTVIGLGDLAEDEILPKTLPLDILLENIKINLIEDRPPVNITSPGSVPINLLIGKMVVKRDQTGVFCIQPDSSCSANENTLKRSSDRNRELLSLQLVMQQLKLDNECLRRQLFSTDKKMETINKQFKHETETLRSCLTGAQDKISVMLNEKRTFLDTIRSLQNQLTAMESYKSDGKR